ncbi:hypothetical protein [Actinomyces lilanjuaniae]|nr:hypothetical protein [Actinomyces lilanjuaniae]
MALLLSCIIPAVPTYAAPAQDAGPGAWPVPGAPQDQEDGAQAGEGGPAQDLQEDPQDGADPEVPGVGADGLPATVSADALPTVQVDGVVWDQVVVGGTVYAVGSFSSARPAGAAAGVGESARGNVLAYDIATGELLEWAPVTNGAVNSVDVSADGSVIYLGGDFTSLNGETTWRVGAVDAVSGRRVPVGASANGSVKAVEVSADGSTLYVGGAFTQVNSSARQRVAAVDLATQRLTNFSRLSRTMWCVL